jgi:hypothetical protein
MLIDSRAINTVRGISLVPFFNLAYLFDFIELFFRNKQYIFKNCAIKGQFSFVLVFRILYHLV